MIINPNIITPKIVNKVWGYEMWIHNDEEYCGKLLVFNKEGDKFSVPNTSMKIHIVFIKIHQTI